MISTPGWVSMWYESHWLFTATATPLANAAPARVTRVPVTHSVAPCPGPTRVSPRRSCASTASRAAIGRGAPWQAIATVIAWLIRALALSITAGGSAS